jgi:hypothetical protein
VAQIVARQERKMPQDKSSEIDLIDRLRRNADLCRDDGAPELAKLLRDAACAVDYFSAHHFKRPPAWVPCRIKLDSDLSGDFPIGHDTKAEAGEHDCDSNQWGAMSVRATNGRMLGVKPSECQIIGWRRNEKA